jgi:hypothetical protein
VTNPIARRDFLAGSLAAGTAATLASDTVEAKPRRKAAQEFYELRIYRCDSKDNQQLTLDHLEHALLPALRRSGASRTGTFTVISDKPDHSIHVLILYPTLDVLGTRNEKLAGDKKFRKAAKEFFAIPKNKPAYTRIETRLMKAFSGMPVVELPASSKKKTERMFELRIYEAHNEDKAARKVAMFNDGEIDIMRDVKLGPVFFGETLVADDVPNLTYMLSADNDAAHKDHWKAFLAHPEWDRIKRLPKYKDTVSKITSIMLSPTSFSEI